MTSSSPFGLRSGCDGRSGRSRNRATCRCSVVSWLRRVGTSKDLAALLGIQVAVLLEVVGELHPSHWRCRVQWLALAATFHVGTRFLSVDLHPLVRSIPHRRPPQSRFSVLLGGARQAETVQRRQKLTAYRFLYGRAHGYAYAAIGACRLPLATCGRVGYRAASQLDWQTDVVLSIAI